VRFGADPKTWALNIYCGALDVDNLYLVDTSFFPSSSAVNPALTAMANALRVGEHLLERLGAAWDIAPPAIFWAPREIAIDVFHHTVYAVATGIAYELLGNGGGAPNRGSAS